MNAATTTATKTATKTAKKTIKTSVKAPAGPVTLGEICERYLKHIQTSGKSAGTVFSYSMDLAIAKAVLGAETAVASLTPERVKEYFESDLVTKTRKGRGKALPTILKTRRVLRLALTWAAEKKLIDIAPLPVNDKAATDSTATVPTATEQA